MAPLWQRAARVLRRLPQVVQFVLVGGAAATTHLLTVALWVGLAQVPPLIANVLAFFTSFGVSYGGHAWLTFADAHARGWRAALRYFLVASVSFAANELLYALALRWLPWHYLASLLAVLLLVAVGTFISAKFWAFRAAGAA
ncbi:GtrA family protein [Melaminivora suipulveris]|uniref:GtrA family protein n=1 Tax=Melaminivora suipulveris TaxID=2109913 RepID=UPI0026AC78BF